MSMKFQPSVKTKWQKYKYFLVLKLSAVAFILQINAKMPTIVGILAFMSMINFMLSCVAHEKFVLVLKLSDVAFIMLINVKMPTIAGILTCMSMKNCMLSCVVHEKVLHE